MTMVFSVICGDRSETCLCKNSFISISGFRLFGRNDVSFYFSKNTVLLFRSVFCFVIPAKRRNPFLNIPKICNLTSESVLYFHSAETGLRPVSTKIHSFLSLDSGSSAGMTYHFIFQKTRFCYSVLSFKKLMMMSVLTMNVTMLQLFC